MENILEKTVKENGNIDLNELSWKQIIALINIYGTLTTQRRRTYRSLKW